MDFNGEHVVTGNQAPNGEINRTFINRIDNSSIGGRGSRYGSGRHANAMNLRAVQIEDRAVINDVAHPQSGASGIAGEIKVSAEIICCDAAFDDQPGADRFRQHRHRAAALAFEQGKTRRPGAVIKVRRRPGGA